jgi:SAM-dependent methyltransferase
MTEARYDGLADEYAAFQDSHAPYYALVEATLCRLLGAGQGSCLDIGCGTGRFLPALGALGWQVTGVDSSADQLRLAKGAELVLADASDLPFPDESFDAAVSTFTHTDVDDFAGLVAEARRVLRPGARFVYVGNHPCFVGPVQEHLETGQPVLHAGYRRAGRWAVADAVGATPGGWRERLGSFVHVPLGEFLSAFAGFTLVSVEEPDDGWDYPKTIALAFDSRQHL